jgi:hypothetical protein
MRVALLILLFFCALGMDAQKNYSTLKTEGCVKKIGTQDCLFTGIELSGTETLFFENPESFAIVMDPSGKLLKLRPLDTTNFHKGRELQFSFVDAASPGQFIPDESMNRGNQNLLVNNMSSFFGTSRFTLIGDEARFQVNPNIYPVTKDKFFVLHYQLDKAKVSKRLGFRDNMIRIQKKSLFESFGTISPQDKIEGVRLYYYEPATKSSELLATFDLFFTDPEQLYSEFKNLHLKLANKESKTKEELTNIFEIYFYESRGKTVPQSLSFTIDEYLNKSLNQ